jgi:nitrogen fixation protein FixH
MDASTSMRPITGRMVLFTLIGFFAIVMAVNAVFVDLALSTNTGIVANEPYRKGLKYNERISADERQSELGWKSEVSINPGNKTLVAALSDRDGKALSGLKATAKVGRAATDREDMVANLTETEPGRYEVALPHLESGGYVANIDVFEQADGSQDPVYRVRRRLWLNP